jgi:methyltransferase (TIGR00027 family)
VEELNVFEVDQPHTQQVKTRKIKEILGYLPSHVNYVPVDIGHDDLEQTLLKHGYDQSKKTLFTMEGFIYYITPELVDEILSFMVRNSPPNSAFIFDYFPECVISGNCHLEVGNLMHHRVKNYGEPFKFGINPEDLSGFLTQRNFSMLENINSKKYGKAYFNGKREVCSIYSFASAVIK